MADQTLTDDEQQRLHRDALSLRRLCRNNPDGFNLSDMPVIQKILEFSLSLVQRGAKDMTKPLENLLW